MPRTKLSEYSTTNSDNTDIESINIAEGCAPSGINNAIRELMVHLKEFQTGASGDAFTFAGGVLISGTANTITGNVLMSGTNTITGSTTATFAAGAVGTPSIAAHGDTNTGIFFPAADTIAFTEGGAEAMRINSSGRVGIGTASPTVRLQVEEASSCTAFFRTTSGATTALYSDGSTGWVYTQSNHPLVLGTNDAERMRIDSSGNVGIGESSPAGSANYTQLAIRGSTGAEISLKQGATTYGYMYANSGGFRIDGPGASGTVYFQTNSTERARINSNGNLLVGTTTAGAGAGYETRLAVDGGSTYDPCMIKWSGTATSAYVLRLWNTATSGDNLFAVFQTEGTPTDRGNIRYNRGSGVVAYNTSSDANLKNIIGDSDGQRSLEILSTTRIREFAWKDDPNQYKQIGVIAQELYETYPGAVTVGGDFEREREVTEKVEEEYTDEEGNTQTRTVTKVVGTEKVTQYRPWSVDKTAFQLHLVAGWQAHEKKIAEQQAKIDALEARLAALEAK